GISEGGVAAPQDQLRHPVQATKLPFKARRTWHLAELARDLAGMLGDIESLDRVDAGLSGQHTLSDGLIRIAQRSSRPNAGNPDAFVAAHLSSPSVGLARSRVTHQPAW